MSGSFEGDLVRPLGLVTLYFGYLEAEFEVVFAQLLDQGLTIKVSPFAPLGRRLGALIDAVGELESAAALEVLGLLIEAPPLLEKRNALVHASVLAKGKVVPNRPGSTEYSITVEELTDLAAQAFSWKDRLGVAVQLRLLPELREKRSSSA